MNTLSWTAGGIAVHLVTGPADPVRVLGLVPGAGPAPAGPGVSLVELDSPGEGRLGNSTSAQHRPYAVTAGLRYAGHTEESTSDRTILWVEQRDDARGLRVRTALEHVAGTEVIRVRSEAANTGRAPLTLTYVSSLAVTGFGPMAKLRLHEARNAWTAELRWQRRTAEQAGLVDIRPFDDGQGTAKGRHAVTATGSWSSGDFLPVGGIEDLERGLAWVWQVEHCGAWHWELGDHHGSLYLQAAGPTGREHQWRVTLAPGESFATVPVAIAATAGGLDDGLRALTRYRRAIRRPAPDLERLPVVFNDYMNCLDGNATEADLGPLIDAAAEAGAEYFVLDAGWYADEGSWWDTVGEWEPSTVRFPHGIETTLRRITDAGMTPGLWLEPEVVGVRSPVVDRLPAEAFFTDSGVRVRENGRFHLDYRCAAVRERMDRVVDRLVGELGAGYLKLDYNISAAGTDAGGESTGAGLLGHNRAFLAWLDGVLARHPALVLENCASGGMRMDYALLARTALQSTSDQKDHGRYAPIAAAAPSAVTPEQSAVWAYPQPEHGPEEASFCLVNAMLGRVHLSGRIDRMAPEQAKRVRTAVEVYKRYRSLLARGQPHWPLGLPGRDDRWIALAVHDDHECVLAVWHRGTTAGTVTLPLPWPDGDPAPGDGPAPASGPAPGRDPAPASDPAPARVLFPADLPTGLDLAGAGGALRISLPAGPSARLIRLHRRTRGETP
ncbi:glycoside hydrolase family 36 protein [Amycolatopsis tolypomycina]|uniref:glycoside hydrolase family 36 protein n=1 Tax=Amycolatopsis tolypomycina TaxID=208445 RepID=UPI0033A311BE